VPDLRAAAIIPARYDSSRLPGKPLLSRTGRPLIIHVLEQVKLAQIFDRILIATDDSRIHEVVEEFGGEAVMTRSDHPTGTDRVAEVARDLEHEIIVNIQGDEPEIDPTLLEQLVEALKKEPEISMATAAAPLDDATLFEDPSAVKVVTDRLGRALYFSRAPIPFPRQTPGPSSKLHVGIYAYRRDFLLRFCAWEQTPLEKAESLEQLRCLEHGHRIQVIDTPHRTIGIDTPQDYDLFVARQQKKMENEDVPPAAESG
jgi:3-deoxy-manno-octulosonate cytidylyltransferase (CMP-KDO synthetase)